VLSSVVPGYESVFRNLVGFSEIEERRGKLVSGFTEDLLQFVYTIKLMLVRCLELGLDGTQPFHGNRCKILGKVRRPHLTGSPELRGSPARCFLFATISLTH